MMWFLVVISLFFAIALFAYEYNGLGLLCLASGGFWYYILRQGYATAGQPAPRRPALSVIEPWLFRAFDWFMRVWNAFKSK